FDLVLRVVRGFPREPIRCPPRVRALDVFVCEREPSAARSIERRQLLRPEFADDRGQTLPGGNRLGILSRRQRRRERGQNMSDADWRQLAAQATQLVKREYADDDHRDANNEGGRGHGYQYCRTVWMRSPLSFWRPPRASSSIRKARPYTSPPSPFTSSLVALA